MNRSILAIVALSAAAIASPVLAQDFKSGDIVIEKPFARATPKGAEVGGAYFTVRNNGAKPDRLTGGTADFANVEIHQMKMDNGVMTMSALPKGLNIPAHTTIRLAPGGYHVMFTHLKKPLEKGDKIAATMNFENAGPIVIEFPVEGLGAMDGEMKGHSMKGMGGMKM